MTDSKKAAHLEEVQLASEQIYDGRVVHLTRDTVRLENGTEALREVIHHPGGACTVPLTEDGCVLMVRQYRYPHACETLELPAGKLEYGENPEVCARRELKEEAGAEADVIPSCGSEPGRDCKEGLLRWPPARELDCVTFGSSSTVENFLAIVPADELKRHPEIKLAAIGPVTAKTLAKNGLPCDVMPEEYTIPVLVQALVDTYN